MRKWKACKILKGYYFFEEIAFNDCAKGVLRVFPPDLFNL